MVGVATASCVERNCRFRNAATAKPAPIMPTQTKASAGHARNQMMGPCAEYRQIGLALPHSSKPEKTASAGTTKQIMAASRVLGAHIASSAFARITTAANG